MMRMMRTKNARGMVFLIVLMLLGGAARVSAQATQKSGPGTKQKSDSGVILVESFDGSANSLGQIMSLSSTVGYSFNKHFSVDIGVPIGIDRVSSSTTSGGGTTSATTYTGIGNAYLELHLYAPGKVLNYASTISATAPTGDKSKGMTTGHVTADWANTISGNFGRVNPFFTAGVGNSLPNSSTFLRPYLTQGMLAHLEEGVSLDLPRRVSVAASLYQIVPWGTQTVYSRLTTTSTTSGGTPMPPGPGAPGGPGISPMTLTQSTVTSGTSSLTQDKGFSFGISYDPNRIVEIGAGYTRSVDLSLNTFSFGVTFNLSPLLRGTKGR